MTKQINFAKKKPQSYGNLAQIRDSLSNFNSNQQNNARNTVAIANPTQITRTKTLAKKFNTRINRNDPLLEQIYSKIVEFNPNDVKVKPLNYKIQKNQIVSYLR